MKSKQQLRAVIFDAMRRYFELHGLTNPISLWAPLNAAALLDRCRAGADGLAVDIRRTGSSWRKPALEAGVGLDPRCAEGSYSDHEERTSAVMTIASEGVPLGVGSWRKGEESRVRARALGELRGLLWGVQARPRAIASQAKQHRVAFVGGSELEGLRSVPSAQVSEPWSPKRVGAAGDVWGVRLLHAHRSYPGGAHAGVRGARPESDVERRCWSRLARSPCVEASCST